MATATELAPNVRGEIILRASPEELEIIEGIVSNYGFSAMVGVGHFTRALRMAAGIRALKASITEAMMDDIMELMNTKVGFKTDRDPNKKDYKTGQHLVAYDRKIVKGCFIESLMYGAYPVGNEWNIIAETSYLTKEYYTRKLDEFPGLEYAPQPGVPVLEADGKRARVPFVVTWKLHGRPGKLERLLRIERMLKGTDDKGKEVYVDEKFDERIPVRVNAAMGDDAVLGKATRKMFKAVYERVSGIQTPDGEADENTVDSLPAPPKRLDDLTARLEARSKVAEEPTDEIDQRQPGDEGEETQEHDPLTNFPALVEACKSITAVNQLEEQMLGPDEQLNENQSGVVRRLCTERKDQLRGGPRGERANGGKGKLFPTAPNTGT